MLPVTANSEAPSPLTPALRPDPAAARARREAGDRVGIVGGNGDDIAVIGAAIAPMAAERHEHLVAEQRQRTALVLHGRIEAGDGRGDPDRPTRLDRTVGERESEDLVLRPFRAHHRGVEIKRAAPVVDNRRARNAERRYVAAGERGSRHGVAERAAPDFRAGMGVERQNLVGLCDDDQFAAPEQGLRVDFAVKRHLEGGVETQAARALVSEAGDSKAPAAVERAMIGQHGLGAGGKRCDQREGEQDEAHGRHHAGH